MANLAQFDIGPKSREARIRALFEDLVQARVGVRPQCRLALAVWFGKSSDSNEQYLLELFTGLPLEGFATDRLSLLWKTGKELPPFANVHSTSVDHFVERLASNPNQISPYRDRFEVLYFDKGLLSQPILEMFQIATEPTGLIKGWYISAREYAESKSIRALLSIHGHSKPELGLVKTGESADYEYSQGLLHIEITQEWFPLSPEGIRNYAYYHDQMTEPGYLLFEGGSLYQILKFEVKTAPGYAGKVLRKTPDDRYPEVYLRAVHPPAQSAA